MSTTCEQKIDSFFSESELKLGELVVGYKLQTQSLSVRRATLFSVTSLAPDNEYLNAYSGHFFIGYDQQQRNDLSEEGYFQLRGGVGKSYLLHRDVMAYGLITVAAGIDQNARTMTSVSAQVGFIFNLAFDSKFRMTHEWSQSSLLIRPLNETTLELSSVLSPSFSVFARFNHLMSATHSHSQTTFGMDYHF